MLALLFVTIVLGSSWKSDTNNKYTNDRQTSLTKECIKKYDSICNVNVLEESSNVYKADKSKYNSPSKNYDYSSSFSVSGCSWKKDDYSCNMKSINPNDMHKFGHKIDNKTKYSATKEHSYARKY